MALSQDIDRLSRIPLLGLLEPDALRLLAFAGETRILAAGDILFYRDEPSDGGILIQSGSVAMTEAVDRADNPYFGPGTLLGEAALLRETRHPATAVARETTTVFKLPRMVFLRVMEEHPESAQRALVFLAQRLNARLNEPG